MFYYGDLEDMQDVKRKRGRPRKIQQYMENETEQKNTNPYIKYIFYNPSFIEKESNFIPINKIINGEVNYFTLQQSDDIKYNSIKVLTSSYNGGKIDKPKNPIFDTVWEKTYSESSITIREIIEEIIHELSPFFPSSITPLDFTSERFLQGKFRSNKMLEKARILINRPHNIKINNNVDGGYDVIFEVEKETEEAPTVILFSSNKDGFYIFSPYHEKPILDETILTGIYYTLPYLIAPYIANLNKKDISLVSFSISHAHSEEIDKLIEKERNNENVIEAYLYYLSKFLIRKDILKMVVIENIDTRSYFEELFIEAIRKNKPIEEFMVTENKETKNEKEKTLGKDVEIVWTEEMKNAVKKLKDLIKDLQSRFGRSAGVSDWVKLLVFALVMSSDYNKPPLSIHIIGDIGTFKTTGSRLVAQYVKSPELVIKGKGNPKEIYDKIITAVSSTLEISPSVIYNRIGGIITNISRKEDVVEVDISIPYIYSLLPRRNNPLEKYNEFINFLKKNNFNVETRYSELPVDIKDHMQLAKVEHYRFSYVPDERLGLLTKSEMFNNYILVFDEGSRNPDALEGMLTKMSISSFNEGVRIIIVTDNLEPHVEMVKNPRYAPLYDRMFMGITSGIIDEATVMRNLYKEFNVKFDMVSLLGINKFVESIPVPEEIMFTIKTISNLLSYKFAIFYTKDGDKFMRILRKNERVPVELPLLSPRLKFDFMPGNRFTIHTIQLSKFNSFLEEHTYVTYEDMKKALYTTIPSRLIVDADTYVTYKTVIIDVINSVINIIDSPHFKQEILKVSELLRALHEKDYEKANKIFKEILRDMERSPDYAPVLMTGLEFFMAREEFDINKIPKPIAYTMYEIALIKGDIGMITESETFYELLTMHEEVVSV